MGVGAVSDDVYPGEWKAERCPKCGRAVVLYRPYVGEVALTITLMDGRVVQALCRRCILDQLDDQ